jgi:AhpD family alkylhydroperoxidase
MQTIQPIQEEQSSVATQRLFEVVREELGFAPNMMKAMAQSPAALEGYLNLSGALANGTLDPQLRRQISLAVAEANHCKYSLVAHASLSRRMGLTEEEILEGREARASEPKRDAALKFVRALVVNQGEGLTGNLRRMREAGFIDGEIVEIVALAVLSIFGDYFNKVAETELDFPQAAAMSQAA